ncbi:MAG TPA: NADH:flavin oxidoreductase/NADH oxidase [Micavibrio sp.]|nr:NADH:flavin oxidoreductase/NADH oxidase [Micavibrio sp.]HIL29450.1 NADH:flavin oxidoreductase/NADH oxidase [Micavibrio sp.]
MSTLFDSYKLKDITLRNRVAVPPMCQYSAIDGVANDWHFAHYAELARGGAGLIVVEATGVSPDGRITPGCTGIWNDEQVQAHAKIVKLIKDAGAVPGLQIAHAGMKASANKPWEGDDHLPVDHPDAWETIAPSAVAFGTDALNRVPRAMEKSDIQRVQNDFVAAAKRALDAGYEWLELHFAHGYLAQSFFSRHTNQRDDEYGGSAENRGRYLLETMRAVRKVWPENLPFTIRFGVLEFDGHDEETMMESIALTKKFKEDGLDFMSVSMGFSTPKANIPWGPAFLAPYAKRIRDEAGIPVGSAWGFDTPSLADSAVRNEELDIVFVGRAHLVNPHWAYRAALDLGIKEPEYILPNQYKFWLERYKMKDA